MRLLKDEALEVDESLAELSEQPDRFQLFSALLLPLENVKQNRNRSFF